MSLEMGKPTSTLHNLGSWTALSLFRLGVLLAVALRHSHASRSSGFVRAEALTTLTPLQQALDGLCWFVVRKGKHVSNESFACTQLNPFTGFMAATVMSNIIAKPKTDVDTLFIVTMCFISIIHCYFWFGWWNTLKDVIFIVLWALFMIVLFTNINYSLKEKLNM